MKFIKITTKTYYLILLYSRNVRPIGDWAEGMAVRQKEDLGELRM